MPDTNTTPGATKPGPQGNQGTQGAQGGAAGNIKPNAQNVPGGATGGTGGGRGGGATNRTNAAPGGQPAPVIDGNSLIQLTPHALQQLLANAVAANTPAVPAPAPIPAPKCPKFWEQEPAAWFMVFRGHYEGRNLDQLALFKALLPLLPALAVSLCRPLVTLPTPTVMDDAQRLLLAHYELGPMERGRALVQCSSLGDRTPREMLQYMRSLQPGEQEGVMFRYVFVSLLPDVVREVVSSIESLDDMALTAGNILQANVASTPRIAAVAIDQEPAAPLVASASASLRPPASSSSRLCRLHAKYGQDAIRCDRPSVCPMKNVIRTTPLPGNGPAGRR